MSHARSNPSGKVQPKNVIPLTSWSEAHKITARARSEAEQIAAALKGSPSLDRKAMGTDQFPFNEIASSDAVIAVVEKLAQSREPDNPWHAAHKALLRTDENGKGYAAFSDTFRNAAFQVGVDYALRSLPSWWSAFQTLDANTKELIGLLVEGHVALSPATKGGAR